MIIAADDGEETERINLLRVGRGVGDRSHNGIVKGSKEGGNNAERRLAHRKRTETGKNVSQRAVVVVYRLLGI